MKPKRHGLLASVAQAALDFHALRLWERYENSDCIVLEVPNEPDPMVASIMGQSGVEHGLCIFRGPNAFEHMQTVLDSEATGPDFDFLEQMSQLSFGVVPMDTIPPEWGRKLKHAGIRGGRDRLVPLILVKEPGCQPREPKPREAETLLWVLGGILQAYERGELEPTSYDPQDELPTLVLSGNPYRPGVVVEYRRYEWRRREEVPSLAASPDSLEDLPALPGRWLVGCPTLPASIKGDDRSVRAVLIADASTEQVLQLKPFLGGGFEQAASILFEAFEGDNAAGKAGLPRELDFSSRALFDATAPELTRLGVRCRFQREIPLLDFVVDQVSAAFGGEAPERDEPRPPPELPLEGLPARDDLDRWKSASFWLSQFFAGYSKKRHLLTDRALSRYFGSREEAQLFLEERDREYVLPALMDWLLVDYRASRKSRRAAEKLLEIDLPEFGRNLLESMMKARPSLYRIESIEPGTSLSFLDIVSGQRVVIHDKLLSESAEVDMLIPARCYAAGDFRFVSLLGPGIPPALSAQAMDYLEREGLRLDPAEPEIAAHLFGRLWAWLERHRMAGLPHLTNTDGDDLVWHTASFSMDSPEAVSEALARRPDLDFEEEDGVYVWLGESAPGVMSDGPETVLGRIELMGGELVLEVNSARRFERAREWLETLPGVKYHGVRTRSFQDRASDPLDDRLPSPEPPPPPPEALRQLGELIRQKYLQWLDESLPALGGQTPREACRTEEGRRKVSRLIRSIPRPSSSPEVDAPREEMLRELGLDVGED